MRWLSEVTLLALLPSVSSSSVLVSRSPSSVQERADTPYWLIGTQTGDATWYNTGLGACGIFNSDDQLVVAVSHSLYDAYPGYTGTNPNNNPVCGRQVTASYLGKSVTVTIVDRCTGCNITDLDFSPTAFTRLADPNIGRLHGMTWVWV